MSESNNELNCSTIYKNNTFLIRIMYRCNTSWQGEIKWLEGQKNIRFRSLLEMIFLIEEILKETNKLNKEDKIKNWR
ncbi:MAG: hypothetical protein ACOC1K_07120 [Nanoarchaeota archaeon]